MSQPLAILTRHAHKVLLTESSTHLQFRTPQDVVLYLRFWKRDAGAMTDLRTALRRFRRGSVTGLSDDAVIEALAVHIARRELLLSQSGSFDTPASNFVLSAPRAPSAAATPAEEPVPRATVVSFPTPPLAPLLPILEAVQIESAEVLPEIMQTLEQIDLTMGEVEVATVSLEPAPSGVSQIDAALGAATGLTTAALDNL